MDEIQLISDGDGLAVVGDPAAVEDFLRSVGLWSWSRKLDLRRLKSLLGTGANVAQAASEIAANSGQWLKLTPESAHVVKKYGLMETKTPGVSHAMVGKPGAVQKRLQIEQGPGSVLTNPAPGCRRREHRPIDAPWVTSEFHEQVKSEFKPKASQSSRTSGNRPSGGGS